MPHIWVEYSTNLVPELDVTALLRVTQDAVIDDGSVYPLAGARTRGVPVAQYLIVDGHPDNSFVHVLVRIGAGRPPEEKQRMGQRAFDAVRRHLAPLADRRPLGLSLQIEEADPVCNYKSNNYRDYLAARAR